MNWMDFILSTGALYRKMFRDNKVVLMSAFMKGKSHQYNLLVCYSYLINRKLFEPIEELPAIEKQRLFEIIKDLEQEFQIPTMTKEEIINACKSLYALEFFLLNPTLGECLS